MAGNNAVDVQPEGVHFPMPMFLLTHHFPANFQGSPETAAAAKDWFARLGATVPGSGSTAPAEPRRLGNCDVFRERLAAFGSRRRCRGPADTGTDAGPAGDDLNQ